MLSTGLLIIVVLVGFLMTVLQLSKLGQNVERLAMSVSRIEQELTAPPDGGDPDWPHLGAQSAALQGMPPKPEQHGSLAALLRGIYCGQVYAVRLLDHGFASSSGGGAPRSTDVT